MKPEHATHRMGQAQHEIRRDRGLSNGATDAVGAEIGACHGGIQVRCGALVVKKRAARAAPILWAALGGGISRNRPEFVKQCLTRLAISERLRERTPGNRDF